MHFPVIQFWLLYDGKSSLHLKTMTTESDTGDMSVDSEKEGFPTAWTSSRGRKWRFLSVFS